MILEIIKYYGSDETKTEFINHDSEPLMAVIAHDRSHAKKPIFNKLIMFLIQFVSLLLYYRIFFIFFLQNMQ